MSTDAVTRTDAQLFADLAARWRADTDPHATPAEAARHPAFAEIVAMREPAIKLALAELGDRPAHWGAALEALTGEDPVPPGARGDVGAMAGAWLDWGRQEDEDRAETLRILRGVDWSRATAGKLPPLEGDFDDEVMPC